MINSVLIQVHKKQHETAGEWEILDTALKISVCDTGNWVNNMAIGLHELVEALICHYRGVSKKNAGESPKDSVNSTYELIDGENTRNLARGYASSVERMLVAATGENWEEYNKLLP